MDGFLAVPKHVSPATDEPLAHVLFALKHEGTNLQILAEALPRISASTLLVPTSEPSATYGAVHGPAAGGPA